MIGVHDFFSCKIHEVQSFLLSNPQPDHMGPVKAGTFLPRQLDISGRKHFAFPQLIPINMVSPSCKGGSEVGGFYKSGVNKWGGGR